MVGLHQFDDIRGGPRVLTTKRLECLYMSERYMPARQARRKEVKRMQLLTKLLLTLSIDRNTPRRGKPRSPANRW
jgi:hypothetical protein